MKRNLGVAILLLLCSLTTNAVQDKTGRHSPETTKSPVDVAFQALIDLGYLKMDDDDDDTKQAEELFRNAVLLRPGDAKARRAHAESLYYLERYPDCLLETREAIRLDPASAESYRLLGQCQVAFGNDSDAEKAFLQALEKQPGDHHARYGLGVFYLKRNNRAAADRLFSEWEHRDPKNGNVDKQIARCYAGIGDYAQEAIWMHRAAAKGDAYAPRWLAWAYWNGHGVPEDWGEVLKWRRIAAQRKDGLPPVKKFGALISPPAEKWITAICLVIFPFFLTLIFVRLGVYLIYPRPKADSNQSWVERARLQYPLRIFMAFAVWLLPFLYFVNVSFYPQSALPVAKIWIEWLAYAAALAGALWTNAQVEGEMEDCPPALRPELENFIILFSIFYSAIIPCFIAAIWMPPDWGLKSLLVIGIFILVMGFLLRGGVLTVLRPFGLIAPANERVMGIVAEATARTGVPTRKCYILLWRRINAFAFPFGKIMAFSSSALEALTDEELIVLCAHELAHLCEPLRSLAIRLLGTLVFFLIIVVGSHLPQGGGWSIIFIYLLVIYLLVLLVRSNGRKMEVRADEMAHRSEREPGTYARALEKAYRGNSTPVVMGTKRQTHPDLYDRMAAAGITPEYPRPEKPSQRGKFYFLGTATVIAGVLSLLWLVLV
jgi:Zn-dependent protease with chaperone function/Tfp pilus assembly protein PilF